MLDRSLASAETVTFQPSPSAPSRFSTGTCTSVKKISAKLTNPGFLAKAPEAVVTENRRRLDEEQTRMVALEAALNRLS